MHDLMVQQTVNRSTFNHDGHPEPLKLLDFEYVLDKLHVVSHINIVCRTV